MRILKARYGGVCFGVQRAIEISLNAARKWKTVYSLGPLIHNRLVVEDLLKKGIITVENIKDIRNKKVIIRSHGIHPKKLRELKNKHYTIVDATCPRVRRAQRYVEKLINEGYHVVIVGEKDHPEVKGLLGYGSKRAVVYLPGMKLKYKKVGVVPQTTVEPEYFSAAVSDLLMQVLEIKIYNTICQATIMRLKEAIRLAEKVEVMIVIGGKNSANTTRLYEICKKYKPSYHVEIPEEVNVKWLRGIKNIGITAGASTPIGQVDRVISYIKHKFGQQRLPKHLLKKD